MIEKTAALGRMIGLDEVPVIGNYYFFDDVHYDNENTGVLFIVHIIPRGLGRET